MNKPTEKEKELAKIISDSIKQQREDLRTGRCEHCFKKAKWLLKLPAFLSWSGYEEPEHNRDSWIQVCKKHKDIAGGDCIKKLRYNNRNIKKVNEDEMRMMMKK